MCTAINLRTDSHYFGRTLDLDRSYGEEVVVTPRNYPLVFRKMPTIGSHLAFVGMATIAGDTPLYYDAVNEAGLAMAGLNFPGNAYYPAPCAEKDNITPFEFIPWILGQCRNISEAREYLSKINLAGINFSENLPLSPLHWMISDNNCSLVVESTKGGLHIYDNPVGVMTNNPPFPYQMENLEKYKGLRVDNSEVVRQENPDYVSYCQGLGAVGLPGDVSSMSRFVRAAFGVKNSACRAGEKSSVGQFFHILASVSMVRGTCVTDEGHYDITGYTCCANTGRGLYYYTTYGNRRISCVDMHKEKLEGEDIVRFPLRTSEDIYYEN